MTFLKILALSILLNQTCVLAQLNEHLCGLGTTSVNRIVGGAVAQKGDWGWQVSLKRFDQLTCGGVILNSDWVATVAHCIPSTESIRDYIVVDIGYTNRNAPNSWSVSRKISKIFFYADNKKNDLQNDIVLLKLSSPVSFDAENYHIVPACVPSPSKTFSDKQGWVTGFGSLYSGGPASDTLRQVAVPIMSPKYCANKFSEINSEVQVCAGYEGLGKDTCQGDSGSPLVSKDDDGKWYIVGLASYGSNPCGDGTVYTRMSGYKEWIDRKSVV